MRDAAGSGALDERYRDIWRAAPVIATETSEVAGDGEVPDLSLKRDSAALVRLT